MITRRLLFGLWLAAGAARAIGADPAPVAAASWPIFRGDAALSGRAPGAWRGTPRLVWKAACDGAVVGSVVMDQDHVYVASRNRTVRALAKNDGHTVWVYEGQAAFDASPLLAGDRVLIGDSEGRMVALDRATGRRLWTFQAGDKILGSANAVRDPSGATLVLFGSYDNRLYAVDLETGVKRWHYEAENFIHGTPAIAHGGAIFGGCDARLRVVRLSDGGLFGAVDAGAYLPGSPAVDGAMAYVGHFAGAVLAIDLQAMRVRWTRAAGPDGAAFYASPALAPDRLVLGGRDKKLHAFARDDGRALWTFAGRGDFDASPVLAGDRVFAPCLDGRLYLVDLADGALRWSYDAGAALPGSPALLDGALALAAVDGTVFFFRVADDEEKIPAPGPRP